MKVICNICDMKFKTEEELKTHLVENKFCELLDCIIREKLGLTKPA